MFPFFFSVPSFPFLSSFFLGGGGRAHWAYPLDPRLIKAGGGFHIDMVYVYVPAFWGAISRNCGFSSEIMKEPNHKLGVFGANYAKKHTIWAKLGAFLSKWYTYGWVIV